MHEKARGGSGVDKPGFVEHLCQLGKVSKPPSAWYTVGAPPRKDSSGFRLLFKNRDQLLDLFQALHAHAHVCLCVRAHLYMYVVPCSSVPGSFRN